MMMIFVVFYIPGFCCLHTQREKRKGTKRPRETQTKKRGRMKEGRKTGTGTGTGTGKEEVDSLRIY